MFRIVSLYILRFWPKTLYRQILLVMLSGLFLANAAGVWLVLNDRAHLYRTIRSEYAAQHMADTINLLGDAPIRARPQLIAALDTPNFRVGMEKNWQKTVAVTAEIQEFLDLIRQQLHRAERIQVIEMQYLPATVSLPHSGKLLTVGLQAELQDGAVVTFRSSRGDNLLIQQPWRIAAWLSLVALAAAILSIWAVRRLTQPLSLFADAAAGLAKNLNQTAQPETGPNEVVHLAQAFNQMQQSIKLSLSARSQMLAGISHDLRLPITRMRLRLEKLSDVSQNREIERDLSEMAP